MHRPVKISGLSTFVPPKLLTNADLEAMVETSDEWILQRTGIRERHIVEPGVATSDLAVPAALGAIKEAGLTSDDIGFIVVGTTTPDTIFPSTACVLFGDGAGAVVLVAQEGQGTSADRGVLSTHLHSDGRFGDILYVDGAVGQPDKPGHLVMHGREVFRHAVGHMSAVVDEALAANGLDRSAIDWLVPHQANRRIIEGIGKKLGLPDDRVVVTVDRHANTSAASIPLALAEACGDGRIRPGQLVLMEALGGGLTWGSALVRM